MLSHFQYNLITKNYTYFSLGALHTYIHTITVHHITKGNIMPEPFNSIQFIQLKAFASVLETRIKISKALLVLPLRLVSQGSMRNARYSRNETENPPQRRSLNVDIIQLNCLIGKFLSNFALIKILEKFLFQFDTG